MTKQQLDLFQLSTGFAAELGTGTPQVMGSEFAELGLAGIANDQPPDCLFIPDLDALNQGFEVQWNGKPG